MADSRRRQRGPQRTALLGAASTVVVGGLLLAVGSVGGAGGGGGPAAETPAARPQALEVRQPAPAPAPSASASAPSVAPSRGGLPDAVVVPALGVDAPVLPIRLQDGALTPPADPQQVGWWSEGARPGASSGSAVLTGHTVHTGGGAFDDLETLVTGDDVVVRTDRGATTYDVVSVQVLGRGELARRSAEVFDQGGPGRLVLITCEDWDGTAYLSNVVVTATPSG